ncbi:SufE family protein [Stagnimonas aquatica]|uniref:SufE family protein n=1 Tax=Stagnimonas aquatica TaxID=2689987 RepID=A0A3N0VK38_9GAMM|nr:SufE family protein [Stagnimonas aquatica]ROH93060.1 SufE family protein [Stagnimonas aquatica]
MDIDELAETFELLGDWEERYSYLIDLGRKLPALAEAERNEETKVRGCMSQVWLVGGLESDGRMRFNGDSDSSLVKGLIALLMALVNGKTPGEILALDIAGSFQRLGLESNITVNRRNGFYSMVERIRALAAAVRR